MSCSSSPFRIFWSDLVVGEDSIRASPARPSRSLPRRIFRRRRAKNDPLRVSGTSFALVLTKVTAGTRKANPARRGAAGGAGAII